MHLHRFGFLFESERHIETEHSGRHRSAAFAVALPRRLDHVVVRRINRINGPDLFVQVNDLIACFIVARKLVVGHWLTLGAITIGYHLRGVEIRTIVRGVLDGDTAHRTATALRTALVGKPTVGFSAPTLSGPTPVVGRVIEQVHIYGRHLEIVWDDGLTLHTQHRLTGSWRLYRVGEHWHKPTKQLRVCIEVADWVAVCFNAPVVETFRQFDRHRHPGSGGLGPDLLHPNANLEDCVRRILDYADPSAPIAEVLLDQHVASGVGNVYRCEALWDIGLSPFATAGSITQDDARKLVQTIARMMRAGITDRKTPFASTESHDHNGLSVYGRNGQRCEICGDTIRVKRIGDMHRLLYWCSECQARGDQRIAPTPPLGLERVMDPHPAAALFLAELPWRREHDDHTRDHQRGPRARPA